jgi:hypothetical protein
MGITKLGPDDLTNMDAQPEVAMNIQIARCEDEYVVVVAGRIAIKYDEELISQLDKLNQSLRSPEGRENYGQSAERWTENLKMSPPLTPVPISQALSVRGFIHLGPRFPLPPSLPVPPTIYGHLPFHGLASGTDVFYRYEPYPTSRRIDRTTNSVTQPNTFASPELDVTFVNSGLGAVARYALPQLLPACWRYELTPPANITVHYGASVPLFGQSGGGVEVSFASTFTNNGPIPPPHVLPIM